MPQPNLLLITTDQQRGDALGLDGHPVLSTPNLDQLGAGGGFFRRAYSEVPSCIPARRILLTGMNQVHTGMVGYRDGVEWEPPCTLPGLLSEAGYQTELIGKLHLWPVRKRYGHDHMTWADGYGGAGDSPNDYMRWLSREGISEPWAWTSHGVDGNGYVGRPWHLGERYTHTYWCVNEALDFLARRDPSAPFYLHVSMVDPHPPLTPPEFYYDRYLELDLPEPVVGDWAPDVPTGPGQRIADSRVNLDPQTMRRCRAAYYGMVNHIDDQVGRLLGYLGRQGLLRDTLILFTSDHGEMLGDHHLFRKTFAYEASARVPFLVQTPRWMECQSGVVSQLPVGLQDVAATFLDAAGVEQPETIDGRSVLPILRGETPVWREAIHLEHSPCYRREDGVQCLCDGHEKYLWYTQTGQEQLFDLDADPDELHDLAGESPAQLAAWRDRLVAALADRPEGFVDSGRLVTGRPHETLLPGR